MNLLSFTNPTFLWWIPAAGVPLLFHWFARIRKQSLPFSTFMFFHRIDPRLHAVRQLREWLLLLLRVLLLLFLLLALSRPLWIGSGSGGRTAAVIVIDNSGSMDGPATSGRSKLDEAREGALALIGALDSGDPAGLVLLVDDASVVRPSGLGGDRAVLESAVRGVKATEAPGRPAEAVARAITMLDGSRSTRREIHVFTDLQKTEWSRLAGPVEARSAAIGVFVHRVKSGVRKGANVSLDQAELPGRRLLAGRSASITVRVSNPSDAKAALRINMEDDQGRQQVERLDIEAGGEVTTSMVMKPMVAGAHWARVWLEGDSFLPDNRAAVAGTFTSGDRVMLVGTREEYGLLAAALAPGGDGSLSGLTPTWVDGIAAAAMGDPAPPALVVVSWRRLDAAAQKVLEAYVNGGGNLLLVPSDADRDAAPVSFPTWAGATPEAPVSAPAGLPLIVFQKQAGLFDELRTVRGEVALRGLRAARAYPLRAGPGAEGLLGLEDGRPVLTQHGVGRGVVFVSGMAFSRQWSNLPLKPAFLAVAQGMALAATPTGSETCALKAGEPIPWDRTRTGDVHIRSLTAAVPMDWRGTGAELSSLPRSGVYGIEGVSNRLTVAVSSSIGEGLEAYLDREQIPALAGLSYEVRGLDDGRGVRDWLNRRRTGRDFTLPFLAACLLAFLAEGWMASAPPRPARRAPAVGVTGRAGAA